MPTLVVGDVHGCYDSLVALLKKCGFDADRDHLWLVGDLVNRGPESLEVLRWARATQARLGQRMVAVLGNHDLHLVSRHAGIAGPKRLDTLDEILTAPDAGELIDWLRGCPLVHRRGRTLMVHAGLLPSWAAGDAEGWARKIEKHLAAGDGLPDLLAWPVTQGEARHPKLRAALAAFTRLRTCTVDGEPCSFSGPPDQAPPGCLPWFRIPDRRSEKLRIVCGHWAALGLHRERGVTALDGGAAWGGKLTALRLGDGKIFQHRVKETRSV